MIRKINYEQKYSMREYIGNRLDEIAQFDRRVAVVHADLMRSSRAVSFQEHYPDRSFNLGIAEQNMVSFAAGLAHEGFMPYAFSMAPFISMRACEQCRTDIAYAGLNVRLVASYSGVSGGISGATHWGLEDIGIMRSIPNMTVVEPSDCIQAVKMIDASLYYEGPVYFRVPAEPSVRIYDDEDRFDITRASVVADGQDGAFICSGISVTFALKAAEVLKEKHGLNIMVVDMHTIKPADREAVVLAAKTGNIITAQDHNIEGGLGDVAGKIIAEEGILTKFRALGIPDRFDAMAHPPYLYRKYGFDAEGLVNAMLNMMQKS